MVNLRGKDTQPPRSPNLNSREYSIWAYMEQKAYKKPHFIADALRVTITRTWEQNVMAENGQIIEERVSETIDNSPCI